MALFGAPDSVNVLLIYANANFPANLSEWALSALVFAVNAERVSFAVFSPVLIHATLRN